MTHTHLIFGTITAAALSATRRSVSVIVEWKLSSLFRLPERTTLGEKRTQLPLKRLINIYVFGTFFVTDVCWLNIRPKRHPWLAICTASGVNHNRWAFFATLQSKNQNKSHCDADEVTYVVG